MKVEIKHIDYRLSLYYSYLLPLFKVVSRDDEFIFTKTYGACQGLRCIQRNNMVKCTIPDNCRSYEYNKILGLNTKHVFEDFMNKLNISIMNSFRKLTLLHSDDIVDKQIVFITVFLSRNTDYYKNAVKWVKYILKNKCLEKPYMCFSIIKSYQYSQLVEVLDDILEILRHNPRNDDFLREALKLLNLKQIGLKTINAYILHAYGNTYYAPIDRHYWLALKILGLNGVIPSKKYCLSTSLQCDNCSIRSRCLYYLSRKLLGRFNGVFQSISYIHGRVSSICDGLIKIENLENHLFQDIRSLCKIIVNDYKEIVNRIKTYI